MKTKKNQGLGGMYSNTTRAISETFGAVGSLASASRALAENAERSAWLSNALSAKETAEELNMSSGNVLEDIEAINDLVAKLRGY